jgi:predicted N-formylglutamate amidohydrolase
MKPTVLMISCEHAVNTIPPAFLSLFENQLSLLESPRAFDHGARRIAQFVATQLACDYTESTISRLLIDCNRSTFQGKCFTSFSQALSDEQKHLLLNEHYHPFRQQTHTLIQNHIDSHRQVLHLSIHTFAPEIEGQVRNTGIGILYDYHRHGEKEVARQWDTILAQQTPNYRVRMNYPFSANADAFIHTLRQQYSEHDYLGLILECNQALIENEEGLNQVSTVLSTSLNELLMVL